MAKKQIIILSHGNGAVDNSKFNSLGEVLVQHGSGATETMLHTLDANSGVTSFPSTAWVENKVDVNYNAATAYTKDLVDVEVSARTEAIQGVEDAISDINDTIASIQSAATENLQDAKDYADDLISGLKGTFEGTIGALEDRVDGLEERVEKNERKLGVLFSGETEEKSVRTIAQEEVKVLEEMLYGSGATEAIDTLKDVIDWIDSDETGAAKIVADIENLQKVTSGYTGENAIKTAVDALGERLKAVEDDYLTEDDKTALNDLITAETKNREDAISGINDTIADIQTAVTKNLQDAKDYTDELLGTGFTAENTVAKAIADEVAARKEAVKGVQDQIDALDGECIKSIEVLVGENDKIVATIAENVATIDLKVIDGGEY